MKHREIIYNGKSAIRSTYNSLGTQMDDYTQHGYEQYHSHEDYQLMYCRKVKLKSPSMMFLISILPATFCYWVPIFPTR